MYNDDDDMGGGGGSSYSGFNGYSGFGGMPGSTPGASSSRYRPKASSTSQNPFVNSGFGTPFPPKPTPKPSQTKPAEITKPLKLSLADLYTGTRKHLKIGRKLLNGRTEDKVLEIDVLPGWKAGTKVRFPKAGNEVPGSAEAQDLVFVVEEKPDHTGKWT